MNDELPPGFEAYFRSFDAKKDGNGARPGAKARRISAAALEHKEFPPVRMVVPGVFVEGLSLLAGKPKIGKSFLALQVALAVAQGLPTLGGELACEGGDVLYCALEDTEPRLQRRIEKLGLGWPDELELITELPRLSAGGLAEIVDWIEHAGKPRLVIIDTLQLIRDLTKANDNGYAADYAALQALRSLASRHNVAIVVVHHLRKAEAEDPFDTVSGTLGLTGAPDAILIIARKGGGFTLHGRGRDLLEIERPLTFDPASCLWRAGATTARPGRWPKSLTLFKRALDDALLDAGALIHPWPNMVAVTATDQEEIRTRFYATYPSLEPGTRRKAFDRALKTALDNSLVTTKTIDGNIMAWISTPDMHA